MIDICIIIMLSAKQERENLGQEQCTLTTKYHNLSYVMERRNND
jgi:hypothetical protein